MNKEFCIHCGHKNLYDVNKPKFCGGCGLGLNSMMAGTVSRSSNINTKDYLDFDDNKYASPKIPRADLNKLKANIEIIQPKKTSLDDLWRAPLNPSDKAPFDKRGTDKNGKDLLNEIQKECAPVNRAVNINE